MFQLQDKHEQLVELLNGYSSNGLPKMPDLLTLGRPHYDPSIFHLEKHWKDIVNGHESLTKHQRDQQEAIWELLTTEVEYIRKLHVVIDVRFVEMFAYLFYSYRPLEISFQTALNTPVMISQCAALLRATRKPLHCAFLHLLAFGYFCIALSGRLVVLH